MRDRVGIDFKNDLEVIEHCKELAQQFRDGSLRDDQDLEILVVNGGRAGNSSRVRSPRLSSAGWFNDSKHRNFNRPAIGEEHHGLARLGKMAAGLPQQLRLGVEHVAMRRGSIGIPSRRVRS